jgi:hypothetical protein
VFGANPYFPMEIGKRGQYINNIVMFPSQDARNIVFLHEFLTVFWLWHFIKHFVDYGL